MGFLTNTQIDELESKRSEMNEEQLSELDAIQTKRQSVPDLYLEKMAKASEAGTIDINKHADGMVRDYLQNVMHQDMSNQTIEQAFKVLGIKSDTKTFANRIVGQAKTLTQIDPYFSKSKEEKRDLAGSYAMQERYQKPIEPYDPEIGKKLKTAEEGGGFKDGASVDPAVDQAKKDESGNFGMITDKEIENQAEYLERTAVENSPKIIHDWASQHLSPKNERVGWNIAMSEDPEATAEFWRETIDAMEPEQRSYLMQLVAVARPEIEKDTMDRLGLAIWNPTKGIGSSVRNYMKGEGLDWMTPRDRPNEFVNHIEKEFSAFELKSLWDKDGNVNPKYADRYSKVAGRADLYGAQINTTYGIGVSMKHRDNPYLTRGQDVYMAGKEYIAQEKLRYEIEQRTQPRYTKLGTKTEYTLQVVEGATYMAELFAVSAIPVVGQAAAGSLMYMQAQSDWERKLRYEYGADVDTARTVSSVFAIGYAYVEHLQIKGFNPKNYSYIGKQVDKKIFMGYFGQYVKRWAHQTTTEITEEWLQAGLEYATMATVKELTGNENIDMERELQNAIDQGWEATKSMPGIMALGGGFLRGGASVHAAVKNKSFTEGVRAFIPQEWKEAAQDMSKAPEVFAADQKVRKTLSLLNEKERNKIASIPPADLEFYSLHHDDDAIVDTKAGVVYNGIDEWLEKKGYDVETAPHTFSTALELAESVNEKKRAEIQRIFDIQKSVSRSGADSKPIETEGVDPKFHGAEYARQQYGERIGVGTQYFETEADAKKAFPDVDWSGKAGAMVGNEVVLIKENISDHQHATQVWLEEALGHSGIAQHPQNKKILKTLRETLGDDLIRAVLPEYAELYQANEAFADEYLAKVISTLDVDKAKELLSNAGVRNKLRNFVADVFESRSEGEQAGREVIDLALQVVDNALNQTSEADNKQGEQTNEKDTRTNTSQTSVRQDSRTVQNQTSDGEVVANTADESSEPSAIQTRIDNIHKKGDDPVFDAHMEEMSKIDKSRPSRDDYKDDDLYELDRAKWNIAKLKAMMEFEEYTHSKQKDTTGVDEAGRDYETRKKQQEKRVKILEEDVVELEREVQKSNTQTKAVEQAQKKIDQENKRRVKQERKKIALDREKGKKVTKKQEADRLEAAKLSNRQVSARLAAANPSEKQIRAREEFARRNQPADVIHAEIRSDHPYIKKPRKDDALYTELYGKSAKEPGIIPRRFFRDDKSLSEWDVVLSEVQGQYPGWIPTELESSPEALAYIYNRPIMKVGELENTTHKEMAEFAYRDIEKLVKNGFMPPRDLIDEFPEAYAAAIRNLEVDESEIIPVPEPTQDELLRAEEALVDNEYNEEDYVPFSVAKKTTELNNAVSGKNLAWTIPQQKLSSAKTSISYPDPANGKTPVIFTAYKKGVLAIGKVNADIGGGRYDQITDWLKTKGVENVVYDPFNRTEAHNNASRKKLASGGADTATISNVLNVIADKDARLAVISTAFDSLKNGGVAYFSMYKAPSAGEVKGRDSFQTGMSPSEYIPEIEEVFGVGNVKKQGQILVAKKTSDAGAVDNGETRFSVSLDKSAMPAQEKNPKNIPLHNVKVELLNRLWDAGWLNYDTISEIKNAKSINALKDEYSETKRAIDGAGLSIDLDKLLKSADKKTVATWEPSSDLAEWAKKAIGTTDSIELAGYVLPDGTFLDFSGSRDGGGYDRSVDHRQLGDIPFVSKFDNQTDDMDAFMRTTGAIHMDYSGGMVDINTEPSFEQYNTIQQVLEDADGGYVDLADGKRRAHIEPDDMGAVKKAIGLIRRFYNGEDIDSGVRFSVAPQTNTKEFKEWFGDSKVVNKDGEPLVVYHGTTSDFTTFNPEKQFRAGYFSKTPDIANATAMSKINSNEASGVVYPVYLSIQTPLNLVGINGEKKISVDELLPLLPIKLNAKVVGELKTQYKHPHPLWAYLESKTLINEIKKQGYDGVFYKEGEVDTDLNQYLETPIHNTEAYIAFNPNQIKSAIGNTGAFDKNNNDVRYSLSGRLDTQSAVTRILANRDVQGSGTIDAKAVRKLYTGMGYEKPDPKVVKEILSDAKAVAQKARIQKTSAKEKDMSDISGIINTEADRVLVSRKLAEVENRAEKNGEYYQQAINELQQQAVARAQFLKESRRGLTAVELKEKYRVDLKLDTLDIEELDRAEEEAKNQATNASKKKPKEQTQEEADEHAELVAMGLASAEPKTAPQTYKTPIDEKLDEIAHAVVRRLNEEKYDGESVLKTMNIRQAMRKPFVLQEYKRTLQNLLRGEVQKFNGGGQQLYLLEKIRGLDTYTTYKGVNKRATKILKDAHNTRIMQTKDDLIDELLEVTTSFKKRIKYRQQDVRRKVTARWEKMFKDIRQTIFLSPEEVMDKVADLQLKINNTSPTEQKIEDGTVYDAIDQLSVLNQFGALGYKTKSEVYSAVEWVKEHLEEEMKKQEERLKDMKQTADFSRRTINATLKPGRKGYDYKKTIEGFNDKSIFLQMRLEELVKLGKGEARKQAIELVNQLASNFNSASLRKAHAVAEDNQKFGEAVQAIFSVPERKVNTVLKQIMAPSDELKQFSKNGVPLSKGQIIQVLATLSQEQYRTSALIMQEMEEQLYAAGVSMDASFDEMYEVLNQPEDTPHKKYSRICWRGLESVELDNYQLKQFIKGVQEGSPMLRRLEQEQDMIAALETKEMQLLDFFRNYYNEAREKLSEVNKKITGFDIPNPDPNYMPAKMDYEQQGIKTKMLAMPVVPANLSPRVFHARDLDESVDVFSIYQQRLESNSQFIEFAPLYQGVAMIFNDPKFISAIRRTHGDSFTDSLFRHLRDVFADRSLEGTNNELIDKLTNYFAVSRLGFNISLFPKQLTSLPAFAMYVDFKDWMKYSASAFTPTGWTTMNEIAKSPHASNRMRTGFTQVMNEMLGATTAKGGQKVATGAWEWYKKNGMMFTKYGDIVPILIFGQGYYRHILDTAAVAGMTEERAKRYAMDQLWLVVEASQQSGLMMNRAEWQRNDSLGRAVGQFISTPQQFLAKGIHDYRMWRGAIESGDKEAIKKTSKQITKTTLINMALAGLYNGMGWAWRMLLGDEPKEEDLTRFLTATITGPMGGMFMVGGMFEGMIQGAATGEKGYGNSVIPLAGLASDAQTAASIVNMILSGDSEGVLKALDALGRANIAPYRTGSKVYHNVNKPKRKRKRR